MKINRQRHVLELAVTAEHLCYRGEMRKMFEILRKQGYGVRGYKIALERALVTATKAVNAINILEA